MMRSRENMLSWGTWTAFTMCYLLMGIATVLIFTGRHKMRLEVDAGVTLGIMASLGSACAALGMAFSRQDRLGWARMTAVWIAFGIACVANGVLLVAIVEN